jgi:hypothetical protein
MYNEVATYFTFIRDNQIYGLNRFRKVRGKLRYVINEEAEKTGIDHVDHYIRVVVGANRFNGMAGCYKDQYAIAFPKDIDDMEDKLLRYVIRHELRHCQPQEALPKMTIGEKEFRGHDVQLYETTDYKIGFFIEDFDEIKCCDVLMGYYRHLKGIEHCLY